MSRLTIPKIPFRSLTMITQGYLFHPRLIPRGTLPKSQISHCPMSVQFDSYFFPWLGQPEPFWAKSAKIIQIWLKPFPLTGTSLHWGNLNPFRPKSPKTVQTWLKLCPLTGTPHEPSLIQKNLSRQFTLLRHTKSTSPTIKVPNLNKKWKNNYDLSIMHLGYLNESKQEKSSSKKREIWNSQKRKIWSD